MEKGGAVAAASVARGSGKATAYPCVPFILHGLTRLHIGESLA
jgi:hypothetical protein